MTYTDIDFLTEANFNEIIPNYNMFLPLLNSGIMVFGDKLSRYEEMTDWCYKKLSELNKKVRYLDQGILNLLVQEYNINVEPIDINKFCCHPARKNYKKASIIHAYGFDKFWNANYLYEKFPEWQSNLLEWAKLKKEYYFENRKDWRKWLADNFDTADGVWFVFPTKSSSEKSIVYNDAVEEALCFGWIDSTIKSLDKEHKIQRFTPRNPKSTYSQANKERLKWLLEHKMIHLEFEDKIRTVLSVPFVFPNDIIDRLKEDERIWKNYQSFSDPYKRIRIAYIEAARKRPEEFERRLNNFICKTKENKIIIGFGGIEKYY